MFTKSVWDEILFGKYFDWEECKKIKYTSPIQILTCLIFSVPMIVLDLVLLPFEIISLIVYVFLNEGVG